MQSFTACRARSLLMLASVFAMAGCARGVFPNKNARLSPGFFARVRVPVAPPHKALLVTDRAIDNDQGQKILHVVNDKNEVVSRPVRLGALHDGLRAIGSQLGIAAQLSMGCHLKSPLFEPGLSLGLPAARATLGPAGCRARPAGRRPAC
jgi:hypothetical protein